MAVVARQFAVGDLVRWTSASGGVWRHHVGVVVAVVPAGERPRQPSGAWARLFAEGAATRPHVSFLVALKRGGHGAGLLYWPRVRHLRPYAGDTALDVLPSRRVRRARAEAATGRELVVWRPRARPRWYRPALVAARAACVVLFGLLVLGLHQVFP